jgi:hypothetical protein
MYQGIRRMGKPLTSLTSLTGGGNAAPPNRAHGPMKKPIYRNLLRRPDKPALGNGRVQRGVERALIAHNGPITTGTAAEWAYALRQYQGKRLRSVNYVYLRRALDRIADRVGHGRGRGRPWLWQARDPE